MSVNSHEETLLRVIHSILLHSYYQSLDSFEFLVNKFYLYYDIMIVKWQINPKNFTMLHKPNRNNLTTQVTNYLGQRILSGESKPGDVLPQEELLCEQLSVSRTVIREAIKSLAAKGLVESRPKVGTEVLPMDCWNYLDPQVLDWHGKGDHTLQMLHHLTELRQAIEPAAAEMAAMRASDEELAKIESACREMKDNIHNMDTYLSADLAFHIAILTATGNPFFIPIAKVVEASLQASLRITNQDAQDNALSLPLHEDICQAILAKDPKRAREAMVTHLGDTAGRLEKA